jgi:glycosyltransferase involved in cell wall biosynthesis
MNFTETVISKKDVLASLQSKKLVKGKRLRIYCDSILANPYWDLLDLYLMCSGIVQWDWIDNQGLSVPRQSLLQIFLNLFRDLIAWPILYFDRAMFLATFGKGLHGKGTFQNGFSLVFLRTDHWFNVKSGGSVSHLSGVIHGFRTMGYKTHVISTDVLMGVEKDQFFHLCMPTCELGRNLPNVPELLYNDQLIKYIDSNWLNWSPSFIYQRYSLGNYVGAFLKHKYGTPYICEYNGSLPWMARHWEKRRLFHERLMTRIELLNLKIADIIMVVSQPLKDELIMRGIDADKILVNPNGVDPDCYSPDVDGSRIRAQYLLDGKTIIGFIGTFGKWHGAEILAEAFGKLLDEYPEHQGRVKLFMIGDGITMPLVKENIEKFNLSENCILTGLIPQEKGPEYLAACDILVASHKPNHDGTPFFGSPTKLFEYMAMGKGIVASDLDQIGEVLKHEHTAWMVKPGDAASLMSGLKVLIDDKPRRDRLGKAARQEVVEKYTWKEHTRKIIDKLKERCGGDDQ